MKKANVIQMEHMDTKEVIDVTLGNTSWVARKIIQDQEVLGYRMMNISDTMSLLKSLDTLKIGEDVPDDC